MACSTELLGELSSNIDAAREYIETVAPDATLQTQFNGYLEATICAFEYFKGQYATARHVTATFDEWRMTGCDVEDVCSVIGFDDGDGPRPGRVYTWNGSKLYVEGTESEGWSLMLDRDDYHTTDLGSLEARLYIYGCDAKAFD